MAPRHRLPARIFYAVILGGVVVGSALCAAAGWVYLQSGEPRPTGHRVWDGIADEFVIPVCVMVGATFGGLVGVATAVIADKPSRYRATTNRT
jgi:hypothetical protein